jgi:2-desacetyl-2-hydroxyethyl bacteriochlorophyllide A dehydrogenase
MMRAVVLEGVGQIAIRDLPVPQDKRQALVQVERTGICGTDIKITSGAIRARLPLVLGHEVIGRVVRSGPDEFVPTGTRVLVDPGLACRHCTECLNGRQNLCTNAGLMGREVDGGLAELVAVGEHQLHPLPPGIDRDAEALLQVLATCVHAQTRIDVFPGQSAVVIGLGVSGLLHAQLLRLRGAHPVIGVTRSTEKRDAARRLGFNHVYAPDEAADVVRDLTGGRGAAVVVECAGTAKTLQQSSSLAAPGASVLVFGVVSPTADALPTYEWYHKELNLVHSRAGLPRDYARAIELAASGMVQLASLVTSSYPLDEAGDAFAACARPSELKVVLDVAPSDSSRKATMTG